MAKKMPKKIAILLFLVVELAVGAFYWHKSEPVATQGFLIKNGNAYIVLWKNKDRTMESMRYDSLKAALEFADQELEMAIGPNPTTQDSAQQVWMREDFGKQLVFWQTENVAELHRLTFRQAWEANIFATAFKTGAYSTSPYGHSISLIPKSR